MKAENLNRHLNVNRLPKEFLGFWEIINIKPMIQFLVSLLLIQVIYLSNDFRLALFGAKLFAVFG